MHIFFADGRESVEKGGHHHPDQSSQPHHMVGPVLSRPMVETYWRLQQPLVGRARHIDRQTAGSLKKNETERKRRIDR